MKSRMTHQVEKEKLTTVLVHIHRSHAEKATKPFVITNSQGPNHDLQERRIHTAVMHRAETRHLLFQRNKKYNRNNEETAYFSSTGSLPSHMKGEIGWSQQSSKYLKSPILENFPLYVCSLQRRFHSMLKQQHSQ